MTNTVHMCHVYNVHVYIYTCSWTHFYLIAQLLCKSVMVVSECVCVCVCVCVQVKKDHVTGKSRGFGFVRFFDPAVQEKVQSMQHTIKDRRIDIKHPRKVHVHIYMYVQVYMYMYCTYYCCGYTHY